MLKLLLKTVAILVGGMTLAQATAVQHEPVNKLPANIALHIASIHYQHPTHFLHPYLNVWSMQGPVAEKAAMQSLQNHFSNINECASDSKADVVLLLEPHIFYNPQLRVFHAEYIARAYTNNGAPITRIKKQASQLGPLNIEPDFFIQKAYTKAIDKVVAKLTTDPAFLAVLNKQTPINAGETCRQLDNLPLDKRYY